MHSFDVISVGFTGGIVGAVAAGCVDLSEGEIPDVDDGAVGIDDLKDWEPQEVILLSLTFFPSVLRLAEAVNAFAVLSGNP